MFWSSHAGCHAFHDHKTSTGQNPPFVQSVGLHNPFCAISRGHLSQRAPQRGVMSDSGKSRLTTCGSENERQYAYISILFVFVCTCLLPWHTGGCAIWLDTEVSFDADFTPPSYLTEVLHNRCDGSHRAPATQDGNLGLTNTTSVTSRFLTWRRLRRVGQQVTKSSCSQCSQTSCLFWVCDVCRSCNRLSNDPWP